MKQRLRFLIIIGVTLLFASPALTQRLSPQGGTITRVTAGAGATGGGSAGPITVDVGQGSGIIVAADAVLIDPTYTQRRVTTVCAAGSSIRAIDELGAVVCETDDSGGSYTWGNGLFESTGTVHFGCGTGLSCLADAVNVDTTAIQARVTGTCAAGSSIRVIDSAGAVTCETDDSGAGGVTGSGTVGTVPRWVTSTTNLGNSSLTDDGTNATATGALAVNGNATVGNADTDEHTINGEVTVKNLEFSTGTHSITAHVDNLALTSMSTTTIYNLTSTNSWQISGITAGEEGRVLILHNTGVNNWTLAYEGAGSTAANRIVNGWGSTMVVEQGNVATLVYHQSRWQVIAKTGRFIPALNVDNMVSYNMYYAYGGITVGDAATDILSVTGRILTGGSAPTPTSCGVSPAVDAESTHNAGKVTVGGSGTTNTCTLTWSGRSKAPFCTITPGSGGLAGAAPFVQSTSASATVYSWSSNQPLAVFFYTCIEPD